MGLGFFCLFVWGFVGWVWFFLYVMRIENQNALSDNAFS